MTTFEKWYARCVIVTLVSVTVAFLNLLITVQTTPYVYRDPEQNGGIFFLGLAWFVPVTIVFANFCGLFEDEQVSTDDDEEPDQAGK